MFQSQSLSDISGLQVTIMLIIDEWGKKEKKPIPQGVVFVKLAGQQQVPLRTSQRALSELLRKGYIRKAVTLSNRTAYVQLRGINRGLY